MNSSGRHRILFIVALLPLTLSAQINRDRNQVLLKGWVAPLYWQPSHPEAEAIVSRPEATTAQLPTTPLVFIGITPCRVVDTRATQGFSGAFGPPSLAANASRTFPLQSSNACTIPSTALAYSMNVTVVPPGPLGYITVYPTGQPLPLAATLTDVQGIILGNSAIVPAGSTGSIDVFASDRTDVVIDINGYYGSTFGSMPNNSTAVGTGALQGGSTGIENTAFGFAALQSNTVGHSNTATGTYALVNNSTGEANTAAGAYALSFNTTGGQNTATGVEAMGANTTGNANTANGYFALANNTTGTNNTATGIQALVNNTSGSNNIALGVQAGSKLSGGSNNIYIGSGGKATDNATIRIGGTFQTSFFVTGVRGITTGNNDAIPVVIDSGGQLGTISSSRRFKEDIQDMGDASTGLLRLRPVTYRYQKPFADGSKPIQYGLIAEEVEEVYPDLVARSADGQIETVKYQVLDSMLLNEVQRQHDQIVSQNGEIRALEERMAKLESALAATFGQQRLP
jgi:hypothetical protein